MTNTLFHTLLTDILFGIVWLACFVLAARAIIERFTHKD